jgi:hypothetical protein
MSAAINERDPPQSLASMPTDIIGGRNRAFAIRDAPRTETISDR